jgi:hypothetical protein
MPWVKGQSGNKSGRPKEYPEVKELARKHTKGNIERLVHWRDQDVDPGASVRAAQYLHEIGWGKPSQSVEISGANGGPVICRWLE